MVGLKAEIWRVIRYDKWREIQQEILWEIWRENGEGYARRQYHSTVMLRMAGGMAGEGGGVIAGDMPEVDIIFKGLI